MAEEQTRIRYISWLELFPWLGLVRAVRLAFAPRMLILAALGLAATNAGWAVMGWMFSGSSDRSLVTVRETVEGFREMPQAMVLPDVSIRVLDPADSAAQLPWNRLSYPFRELFEWDVTVASFTYLLLCGVWALLVWSLFGGAISRGAALWFAREDRLSFRRLLGWGVRKWPAYFGGPIFPLVGVLIAVVPVAVLCILLKAPIGVLVVGIVWPVVLLCGLFLAILLVGLLFGWPLMWPTVSAEGTDSFDALSRSYSYTYQRPVHYLFYAAVAGVLGMLAWIVVLIFARGVITYSYWAASWGSGAERIQEIRQIAEAPPAVDVPPAVTGLMGPPAPEVSGLVETGSRAIGFWVRVVKYLAVAYLFSYFWCAATYIYFLLRQAVDATELDEVAVEEETEVYGLPPLASEPGASPQVADSPTP
ncbi:MAG TPA: hypothetical protein VMJ32_02930 [Pirellulales bacterium]|nr:hypothetical protein [Pirellulales bacterium]